MYVIVGIIVVAAVAGYFIWQNKSAWKTLETGTGSQVEELEVKRARLRDEGIRCRVKTLEAAGTGMAMAGMPDNQNQELGRSALQVHEKDIDRARIILDSQENIL